jgi:hypothetical protein
LIRNSPESRGAEHDAGVPGVAGDQRRRVEALVVVAQILDQLDRRHAGFDFGGERFAVGELGHVGAEPHRDLGLDRNPAIIRRPQPRRARVHLARENRAPAGFVDAAQLLHDRRRQRDLVAGDGAAPVRLLELLVGGADRVGLVEVGGVELGRQHLDAAAIVEEGEDALGLLVGRQIRHRLLP